MKTEFKTIDEHMEGQLLFGLDLTLESSVVLQSNIAKKTWVIPIMRDPRPEHHEWWLCVVPTMVGKTRTMFLKDERHGHIESGRKDILWKRSEVQDWFRWNLIRKRIEEIVNDPKFKKHKSNGDVIIEHKPATVKKERLRRTSTPPPRFRTLPKTDKRSRYCH